MKYLLALLLLTTPAFAEMDYVVSGDDVYKIEIVSKDDERVVLEAEFIQATSQVQSYKDNIAVQQDGLNKAEAWLKDVQDKIATIEEKPVIVDKVVYPGLNSNSSVNW